MNSFIYVCTVIGLFAFGVAFAYGFVTGLFGLDLDHEQIYTGRVTFIFIGLLYFWAAVTDIYQNIQDKKKS
ncbi:hypothetical protein [Risungbinella massiliensis]|uniref:hypothetical protein n=1 Tax=Risungbinella massiliensis TaxID=1329796 RepID=UPI0005CBB4AB|nr:hypothetical protein [Risungbinella massiliensis]